MPFPEFDPFVFGLQWNGFGLRWYALAYVAGLFGGWWYGIRLANNSRIWDARGPAVTRAQIDDLILWIALGVIVGGRLGSVLFYNTSILWTAPLDVFKIWEGGMSFHGGLIGVTLALIVYARRNGINLLHLADQTAPCVPIGLFFGRVANFVNGELWGRPTDAPWAFIFPAAPLVDGENLPRHPSQLYEAALEGLVLFLVLRWATHHGGKLKRRGWVAGMFLLLYGVFRASLEVVREPDLQMPEFLRGYVTMGMLLCIPMILGGAYLIWRSRRAAPVAEAAAEPAQPDRA